MKLLLITNVYPNPLEPTKGVFNQHLVRTLTAEHRIDVVSPVSWVKELSARRSGVGNSMARRSQEMDGATVHYPRYYYPPRILRSAYGFFYWQSIRATVRRIVDAEIPDAVIGYWAHPDGTAAVRVARQLGVPSVVMVGGSDVLVVTETARRRRAVADSLKQADAIVTLSKHLEAKIAALGVDPLRIRVWQRGVDAAFVAGSAAAARQRLGIENSGNVLVWVGRFVPVKGLDVLIHAAQIAHQQGARFKLYLIGDGPLRAALEADRDARGLQDVIHFVGARMHHELPDWYRAADFTLLSSFSEGIPNVLRESLACGTPFIATAVGGVPELAGERTDGLVPPRDPQAFAQAIVRQLSQPKVTPPSASSPSWHESGHAFVALLQQLISRRQAHSDRSTPSWTPVPQPHP